MDELKTLGSLGKSLGETVCRVVNPCGNLPNSWNCLVKGDQECGKTPKERGLPDYKILIMKTH